MKFVIAAGVALIALAGLLGSGGLFLFSVESATVDISLPAWRLDSWVEAHGAPSGGEFQTHRGQVTLTESVGGTATGSVLVGAGRYATGYVVLGQYCILPGMTCPQPYPALSGYQVCQPPNAGRLNICYVLQAGASCFCGERVPVRALGPGSGSNLPANRVTAVTWSEPYGTAVTVNNPAPISGGTDGTPSPMVTQADINAASASARAQVSADLLSTLLVEGGGLTHVIPDGTPQIAVTSNVVAGARTNTFQVTATGTLGATEFRDSDAQAVIAKGMNRWVPHGYRLNGGPVVTDYQVEDWNQQGNITVSGTATDYMVANFSIDALRSSLRGVSLAAARSLVEAAAPGSRVDIRLRPVASPMLPLDASRISISLALHPATAA